MKKTIKYNLILHNKENFEECLKEEFQNIAYKKVDIEKHEGLTEGRIYIAETIESPVDWIKDLNTYTKEKLNQKDYRNKSNKAIMMLKYKTQLFSLVYGYGRTMLEESSIKKNFGLRTAINLISPINIKSINSLNFSTDYVDTQRQALNFVSQNELNINEKTEIIKSISGKPDKPDEGNEIFFTLNGTDSLLFSASTEETLMTILDKVLEAFESKKYKENGFEWIDYIQPVKIRDTITTLDEELIADIKKGIESRVTIAPNKILDFSEVGGYFISGMREIATNMQDFYDEIPTELFLNYMENYGSDKENDTKINKLKNSSLYFWNETNSKKEKISSVYNCILFETTIKEEREDKHYFLNNGDWFKIEKDYYKKIVDKVNEIPKGAIKDPIPCQSDWNEGKYNEEFVKSDINSYYLFDKQNYKGTGWGRSKIEPADIITKNKQFIHVKKGGSSSTLSHLFAQGLVSSQLVKNEVEFITHLNNQVGSNF